jgi:hypothetical protein
MNTCLCPPDARSVYADCVDEANRYKWIESEKVGYDLGETAISHWVRDHWSGYLRARWVEHLQGKCFWIELDRGDYGLLEREFMDDRDLLTAILDRLKSGDENLGVICWAMATDLPLEPVHRILEALDVNSRRLAHRFENRR